ncbi:uncharacterized protein LOC108627786 [Ceratina calcarata]|uniref:Uncharacterized protein LOC108627786 n=1 Tax=Ceratina calcarata TaxID=156304 RepID=A0AAJ7S5B8_9HYME|nr:uncharacterized protein LOC108627786 [Ceratina calcarata]XP_026671669.1 uncharacterized protein LOC108627786 [Ceratina calcarata]XP_026671670.1 uncharacterized protein LOC108627786 [Ceratina calcarata]
MSDFEERKLQAIALAGNYQQYYYEMLPDWFEYGHEDYTLIKQKIGYALFGPPKIDKDTETEIGSTNTSSNNQHDNIFNRIVYDKKMCKVIDTVYKQIIRCGGDSEDKSIYIGILYNVLFLHTIPKKTGKQTDDQSNDLCMLPLIKVRKSEIGVWYIDNDGRVYQSWDDYVKNNTLPKCTMILPKCGLYQSNPEYKVAECCSTVWLEVLESPACSTKGKILQSIDVGANMISLCTTFGLTIASLVTPIGPAAITAGLVYSGVSGSWIIARSSQKLVDLARHRQSISPISRNAFPAWLGIGSTALSMGATGGTALLSNTVNKCSTVGSAARVAYNSMLFSNLAVNGLGVAFQGYCLIDKYKSTREVDFLDIVMFTSHVLFFSNTLISTKLAGELIGTSKGTIFERFKNSLRSNRFMKEFAKTAPHIGQDGESTSEGIIYKIKNIVNKEDFLDSLNEMGHGAKSFIKYSNGNIVVHNRIFIDPVVFTGHLLTAGTVVVDELNPNSSTEKSDVMIRLKVLLVRLIRDFFSENASSSGEHVDLPNVENFVNILQEVKFMDNAVDVLTKIFKVAVCVVQNYDDPRQFLVEAVFFAWNYCKANLKEYGAMSCSNSSRVFNVLTRIITFLFDCIDEMKHELFTAFHTYISNKNL